MTDTKEQTQTFSLPKDRYVIDVYVDGRIVSSVSLFATNGAEAEQKVREQLELKVTKAESKQLTKTK